EVGRPDFGRKAARELGESIVEIDGAIGRLGKVAVFRVPGLLPLEEGHLMAACRQRLHKGAIGGRMSIAPGRGNGKSEDDDLQAHCAASPMAAGAAASSTVSTCCARCS